jgi:hypothetical protein
MIFGDLPSARSPLDRGPLSDARVVARGGAVQITGQLMQGGLSLVCLTEAPIADRR